MIRIELLSTENFKPDSLDNYPRKQDVKKYTVNKMESIFLYNAYIQKIGIWKKDVLWQRISAVMIILHILQLKMMKWLDLSD